MKKQSIHQSLFSKIDQVGVIVRDLDKAVEYYEDLGIGPFESMKSITIIDRKIYDKPAPDMRNSIKVAKMDPLEIELIQPVIGESLHKRFLETHGEGINHLGFYVEDFAEAKAMMLEKGFKVNFSWSFAEGGGGAYFDTDKVGGIQFELVQWPQGYKKIDKLRNRELEGIRFWRAQLGVIVKDLDRAVAYYEDLGLGPFGLSKGTPRDRIVYGKPAPDVKNKAKVSQIGPIEFELLQPVSGESVQRKFLENKGEGISHLGFHVNDLEKETGRLVMRGFNVISSGRYVELPNGGFSYLDTDRIGGVQFELMQQPK